MGTYGKNRKLFFGTILLLFSKMVLEVFQNLRIDYIMRLFKHSCPEFKIKILDYTYTSEPSINSALPLKFNTTKFVFFVIGCLLSSGFLWLIAKWSSKKKAILLYDVCDVYEATDFLIEEEEVIGGSTIVERFNKYDIKRK